MRPVMPVVHKIMNQTGPLAKGQIIKYDDIEQITGIKRMPCPEPGCTRISNRWNTVTWAWRRYVKKKEGLIIGAQKGTEFKVLNDPEVLLRGQNELTLARNKLNRAKDLALYIKRSNLTPQEKTDLTELIRKASDGLSVL